LKDNGHIVPLAELVAQPVQHLNPNLGEAAEQKHALLADRVNDAADLFIVKEEVDELRDL
jgi:hypothetical protein